MSADLASSFPEAWFDEFASSWPAAAVQLGLAVAVGGRSWHLWAKNASSTAVFSWMAVLTAYIAAVIACHAWRAWQREHKARVEADDRYSERPILVPEYEDDMRRHGFVDDGEESRITVVNRGSEDAVDIRIADVDLGLYKVTFLTNSLPLAAGTPLTIVPEVRDKDTGILEPVSHSLGWAFNLSEVWRPREDLKPRDHAALPFTLLYQDLHGRTFQTDCVVELNRLRRTVSIRYVKSFRVTELSSEPVVRQSLLDEPS